LKTATTLGFRVVGHANETRRIVDHAAAFAACAECDPRAELEKQSFISIFHYPADIRSHLAAEGSERGYAGPCGARRCWWDIDRADDPERALRDSRRLAAFIVDRFTELDDDDLLVFFSGSKGYHVGIPLAHRPESSPTFHAVARRFCETIAQAAGVVIDTAIYSKTRLFRAPNSRHSKTGLHKRRLSYDELLHLRLDAIRDMAREPEPFDIPPGPDRAPRMADDWRLASRAAEARVVERKRYVAAGPRLQRATADFLRGDVAEGERELRLFRASANLGEFGCPPDLALALLEEPGRDSGLTPAEVHKAILDGLNHAARQREGGSS